jgi:hypothetical protein
MKIENFEEKLQKDSLKIIHFLAQLFWILGVIFVLHISIFKQKHLSYEAFIYSILITNPQFSDFWSNFAA